MKALFIVFILCSTQAFSQVPVIKIDALTSILEQETDTVFVINFWATWCKPCIEELPFFEEANAAFYEQKVRVLLVSLDSPKELDRLLLPFVKKKDLKTQVLLLDEQNPNVWIDKIETRWTGSLPATIIQHNRTKKREFFERQLDKQELFTTIQSMME